MLAGAGACGRAAPEPSATGQWIWSSADSVRFAEASRTIPLLLPTVWIGTIRAAPNGTIASSLGLSPRVSARREVSVIVRFDDSFSSVWKAASDSTVAASVGFVLRSMIAAAQRSGVTLTEIQLDYDCPDRLLARWSRVVSSLARDALAGQTVWLTSIVAHVRRSDYGDLFRAHVAGHILQVFDTDDRMSPAFASRLERMTSQQRMPFRLGVAAFERRLPNGRTTDHRAWFTATHLMAKSAWYRGVWIFPAGESWVGLLETGK